MKKNWKRQKAKLLSKQTFIFAGILAVVGSYFIIKSFAAEPPPASIPVQVTQPSADFAPGTVLVKFKDGVSESAQQSIIHSQGGTVTKDIPQIKVHVVKVPDQALDSVITALSHNPSVEFAEKDPIGQLNDTVPNDPCFPFSPAPPSYCKGGDWGSDLNHTQMVKAWDTSTGSSSTIIAIIDSGVSAHPDLDTNLIAGFNILNSNTDATDTLGHGTEAAGVAAGVGNNGIGVTGRCWSCSIMPIKVTNTSSVNMSDVASGITWAADHGANVLSLSLSSTSGTSTLQSAVNYAISRNILVVAGAGNNANSTLTYPASYANVLSVAGSDYNNALYSWSSFGSWVKIAAPGQNTTTVLTDSTGAQWGYNTFAGTSSATPVAAGIAGLLRSAKPTATNTEIMQAITNNTDVCCSGNIGGGRINAYKAMTALVGSTGTKTGDINGDGHVDIYDFSILAANWSKTGQSLSSGDITGDGKVDISDLTILAATYGT